MKTSVLLAVALATAVAAGAGAQTKTTAARPMATSALADKLMANENALIDSVTKKDLVTFKKFVAPGSWSVDENGVMNIDEFLKSWNDLMPESGKTSDMKVVHLDPNAALVTYRLEQKGSFQGMQWPPVVYATTAWVNHGGTWHAVFHQESTAAKK